MTDRPVTIEAVKLLECVARQTHWTFGCFDLPGNWSQRERWLASESLSVRFEDPADWRDTGPTSPR